MSRISSSIVTALAGFFIAHVSATPVINEIMFHSAAVPENNAQEWIELRNDSPTATFNLTGWRFSKGVDYTFPNGTTLVPGAYLVIAADVATFQAQHPGFAGTVVGGWVGTLSNSSEHIKLVDSAGATIDEVHYASDGEWALRARGPLSLSHKGWIWVCDADGAAAAPELRGGKTIELRNPALSGYDSGQNWGFSAAAGGSPGAVNSVASANVAPLIKDVKHRPEIPKSTDPIVVSCNLHDEGTSAAATLQA